METSREHYSELEAKHEEVQLAAREIGDQRQQAWEEAEKIDNLPRKLVTKAGLLIKSGWHALLGDMATHEQFNANLWDAALTYYREVQQGEANAINERHKELLGAASAAATKLEALKETPDAGKVVEHVLALQELTERSPETLDVADEAIDGLRAIAELKTFEKEVLGKIAGE